MRTRIIAAVVVLGLGIVGITLAQQPGEGLEEIVVAAGLAFGVAADVEEDVHQLDGGGGIRRTAAGAGRRAGTGAA